MSISNLSLLTDPPAWDLTWFLSVREKNFGFVPGLVWYWFLPHSLNSLLTSRPTCDIIYSGTQTASLNKSRSLCQPVSSVPSVPSAFSIYSLLWVHLFIYSSTNSLSIQVTFYVDWSGCDTADCFLVFVRNDWWKLLGGWYPKWTSPQHESRSDLRSSGIVRGV